MANNCRAERAACPSCGGEVAVGDQFCRQCGASLQKATSEARSATVDDMYAEYRQRTSDQPQDADARYNLGLACLYQRRYREAVTHFRAVIQLLPGDPAGYEKCAIALARLGDRAQALAVARSGLCAIPHCQALQRLADRLART